MQAVAIFLLASLLAVPAAAGTTGISISQVARFADGNLVVAVQLGNTGDESALSVIPILRLGDKEVRGKGTPRLAPEASYDETLSLPVGTLGEGRWLVQLAVDYTDLNQYPFQALQTEAIVIGSPPPVKMMVAAIRGGDISGTGSLEFTLKNLTPESRTARVRVLVPDGIDVTGGARQVSLDPWAEADLEVPLTNRTALVGSRYPAFVTVEYDDGSMHQAVVAQGTVAIVGVGSFLDRWGSRLQLAAIALVVAWLGYLGAHLLQRQPTGARS